MVKKEMETQSQRSILEEGKSRTITGCFGVFPQVK